MTIGNKKNEKIGSTEENEFHLNEKIFDFKIWKNDENEKEKEKEKEEVVKKNKKCKNSNRGECQKKSALRVGATPYHLKVRNENKNVKNGFCLEKNNILFKEENKKILEKIIERLFKENNMDKNENNGVVYNNFINMNYNSNSINICNNFDNKKDENKHKNIIQPNIHNNMNNQDYPQYSNGQNHFNDSRFSGMKTDSEDFYSKLYLLNQTPGCLNEAMRKEKESFYKDIMNYKSINYNKCYNKNNNINNIDIYINDRNNEIKNSFVSNGGNYYLSNLNGLQNQDYNNSRIHSVNNCNLIDNIINNYTVQENPLEKFSNEFNSNELVFKEPFSFNTAYYKNLFLNNRTCKKQLINLENIARGIEKRTTIMIRNVPIRYTIEILEVELEIFKGKFDCIHMPYDYENKGNKGYSFINFLNPYHILLFYEIFNNKCWSFFDSKKVCSLNFANFQGIEEIKKHAKNYRGKKPKFFNVVNNYWDNTIEIPKKYVPMVLKTNSFVICYENTKFNTIILRKHS